jgi:outer membrane murein-binding lipoprotein Lpp
MLKKLIFICGVITVLIGCSPENSNSKNETADPSNLNSQVSNLQDQVDQIQNDLNQLSDKVTQVNKNYVLFSPSSKGYSTVYTDVGFLLVSLDSLTKYANGYRATFRIGNPSLVVYNGVKIQFQWGQAYTKDRSVKEWLNSLKSDEIEINKSLLPGVWNKISVVLSPATASETGTIFLRITTSNIYLNTDIRTETN